MSKIHEQITKETWTQGRYADGNPNDFRDVVALCKASPVCCLDGWFMKVYGTTAAPERQRTTDVIRAKTSCRFETVVSFNDSPLTEFEDVLEVLKLADA